MQARRSLLQVGDHTFHGDAEGILVRQWLHSDSNITEGDTVSRFGSLSQISRHPVNSIHHILDFIVCLDRNFLIEIAKGDCTRNITNATQTAIDAVCDKCADGR